MPVCARVVQYTDGSSLLALDPAVTNLSTCAYVVETGSEFGGWTQLLSMTPDEALVISGAVALLWAVAWGFRILRQVLFTHERYEDE